MAAGEFEFTHHALRRAAERNIAEQEIRQIAENAKVIEDYPEDKYSPSCLVFGYTKRKRPLHLQGSYADTDLLRIITLYESNQKEWIEFTKRS
ncbi:MAG: DUF4258 domain-containing protein [Chloroflexi bacterium]|nr:DUF4258 domain-containing protein [Chloroflexota bacterium]